MLVSGGGRRVGGTTSGGIHSVGFSMSIWVAQKKGQNAGDGDGDNSVVVLQLLSPPGSRFRNSEHVLASSAVGGLS